MTRILFITSTRIGDAILSMGVLDHIINAHPDARLTIVCGNLPASLFEAVPSLERLIVIKKQKMNGHWFDLWRDVVSIKWDIVIDLRNSIVSRTILAKTRYIFGPHIPAHIHKVKQNALTLKLDSTPMPRLFLSEEHKRIAENFIPQGSKVLGVGPTANWIGKTWPRENFVELIKNLTLSGAPFFDWRVAIFAAPGEEDDARFVLNALPPSHRIDIVAKTNPAVAAACLARCDFYIGNDSGLMHAAAAAGTPTIGLFGASYVDIYGPYGKHTACAHTPQSYDELTNFDGYDPKTLKKSLMTELTVDVVEKTILDFLKTIAKKTID